MSSFLPQKPMDESQPELAFDCMEAGHFSAAFQILSGLSPTDRVDVLFALGVCLFAAGDYAAAAGYFEQSLTALKRTRAEGISAPKTAIYQTLRKAEIARQVYLKPFRLSFAEMFFEMTKENIIIALAEAFLRCGNTDKAKLLVNSLHGDEFGELKARINAI